MSEWRGANIGAVAEKNSTSRNNGNDNVLDHSRHDPQSSSSINYHYHYQEPEETVEAALNRLHRAYTSFMECVSAWHRAIQHHPTATQEKQQQQPHHQDEENNVKSETVVEPLRHVAQTARQTLQNALLCDPLVRPYLQCTTCMNFHNNHPAPVSRTTQRRLLTSESHKAMVRQLTYLSLVNYADLLVSGASSSQSPSSPQSTSSVLDRGLVRPIPLFASQSCWRSTTRKRSNHKGDNIDTDHDEEDPIRLAETAVAALIDASAMDGSDPVVWLKLACAARRLGRLQQQQQRQPQLCPPHEEDITNDTVTRMPCLWLKHRRLERHALEQGAVCLPATMPRNRLIAKALQEWYREQQDQPDGNYNDSDAMVIDHEIHYDPTIRTLNTFSSSEQQSDSNSTSTKQQVIQLTRYSWSALGRILLRSCRCVDYSNSLQLQLSLSPVLALPSSVLAHICSFLPEEPDIRSLESTCRALSFSVVSARTTADTMMRMIQKQRSNQSNSSDNGIDNKDDGASASDKRMEDNTSFLLEEQQHASNPSLAEPPPPPPPLPPPTQAVASRVSKRLQSQHLNTSRASEQSVRRSSVEFCLLKAVLGCTPDSSVYQEACNTFTTSISLKGCEDWMNNTSADCMTSLTTGRDHRQGGKSTTLIERQREEARERLGDSSLASFVLRFSGRGYSPLDILFGFVAHTSIYIGDVFISDPGGAMVLSSILFECVELMLLRSHKDRVMIPSWAALELSVPRTGGLDRKCLFSIDLMHAELRLRRCESDEVVNTSFDGDCVTMTTLVPVLEDMMIELERSSSLFVNDISWTCLKCRCFWFLSNYYLWRSRMAHTVSESREAEKIGLDLINQAIAQLDPEILGSVSMEVSVPHLDSAARSGLHWKTLSRRTLVTFRDEVQAASIVLQAREQFVQIIANIPIDVKGLNDAFDDNAKSKLFAIGSNLIQRYNSTDENVQAKRIELIDDFLSLHGDALLSKTLRMSTDDNQNSVQMWIQQLLPADSNLRPSFIRDLAIAPCTLSLLSSCLLVKEGQITEILRLYSCLVVTLSSISKQTVFRIYNRGNENRTCRENDFSSSLPSDDFDVLNQAQFVKQGDLLKLRMWSRLSLILLGRISCILKNQLSNRELIDFVESQDYRDLILKTLSFCSELLSCFYVSPSDSKEEVDELILFRQLHATVRIIQRKIECTSVERKAVDRMYIHGLMRSLIRQRLVLEKLLNAHSGRQGRSARLKVTKKRAEILAEVCCWLGWNLSYYHTNIIDQSMIPPTVLSGGDSDYVAVDLMSPIFCECLLWLWNLAINDDTALRDRLLVPIATVIVGFCGCATRAGRYADVNLDPLSTLYDSDDDSALPVDLVPGSETILPEKEKSNQARLIASISQAIYCIENSFGSVDENSAVGYGFCDRYISKFGPLLPLVATRVLNHFSKLLIQLQSHCDSSVECSLECDWSEYPCAVRSIGQVLDSLLYKAYKCLHGFTLISDSKETTPAMIRQTCERFPPENIEAAVFLYKCIKRAYSNGRRSPPKAALDLIVDALPPVQVTEKSILIRHFLFSFGYEFELEDLSSIASSQSTLESLFLRKCGIKWSELVRSHNFNATHDECMIVRRGIAHLLAQAPIPTAYDMANEKDERIEACRVEGDFNRKFDAIVDDLSLGNTLDCEGWFNAAQCIIGRADLIADRVGLSNGFARCNKFTVKDRQGALQRCRTLNDLLLEQKLESNLSAQGWVSHLSVDVSSYCKCSWCSFSSLNSFADNIHSTVLSELNTKFIQTFQEIKSLLSKEDYSTWQAAWGGLLIYALRKIAQRCLLFALLVVHKLAASAGEKVKPEFISQIFESIGSLLYAELSGSEVYGYPMRSMPSLMKREIASVAVQYFEQARDVLLPVPVKDRPATWDITFMIGKCREKMASTFTAEAFSALSRRQYELYMEKAFLAYATSLEEATALEKEGLIDDENGGSSHGSAEVLYRLHATRLKCLIAAVDRHEDDIDAAEAEALRVTENYWYGKAQETSRTVRDRVWSVLSDVVTALVHCRMKYSCFHRSVYRHAQALLWAHVFNDPKGNRRIEEANALPASRACNLRGMNSSTDSAESAYAIINNLFERKRQQLVAVWLTTNGSATTFRLLNSSVRKYDSLRGKYIAAYLEVLRLCKKRNEIENFLRSLYASSRDLPLYYSSSALTQGDQPKQTHADQCLLIKDYRSLNPYFFLTSMKRLANGALAAVILTEMKEDGNEKSPTDTFKEAFSCFVRLKCSIKDIVSSTSWKYEHTGKSFAADISNRSIKHVVDAIAMAYTRTAYFNSSLSQFEETGMQSDWSNVQQETLLLLEALKKGEELFPNLSFSFFTKNSKKLTYPSKRKLKMNHSAEKESESNVDIDMTETIGSSKKSYRVTIPDGLKTGSTFVVAIDSGGRSRKVRLTVPDQHVKVLRFSLPSMSASSPSIRGNSDSDDDK